MTSPQNDDIDLALKSESTSQIKNVTAFVSPYDFNTPQLDIGMNVQPTRKVSVPVQMKTLKPNRSPEALASAQVCKATNRRSIVVQTRASRSPKSELSSQSGPTKIFEKEELKILSIIGSQQATVDVFAAINSYTDCDSVISIRELSTWLPIQFPRFGNTTALKLAIKNAAHLQHKNEMISGSKDLLLAKMRPRMNEQRKINLEIHELPIFFENLLAYNRIANLLSRIVPNPELKLTKLELYSFLKATNVASNSQVAQGLLAQISNAGSVSFAEMCRISFDLGFMSLDIREANNRLSHEWDSNIEKPKPRHPPVRKIKSHNEIQSEMHSKIVSQTRCQDAMSSSVMPYMVKSRLRIIKQRQKKKCSSLAELSCSSFESHFSVVDVASAATSRPNSAGRITSLWKRGSTPRDFILQNNMSSESSLISRTQRSIEQGSNIDTRRSNPLYIDTQNGQTVYDIPVLSAEEYLKHCPMGQDVFKRIVDQQGVNPFAFTTSRSTRLYGVHTSRPGIVRPDFDCSFETNKFFHNVDINIRRQYRPCTAAKLQTSTNDTTKTNIVRKPSWCIGAVPWNGKSTELPKYSGDIGFFEPNVFQKRFDIENIQLWSGTARSGHLLNTPKIKTTKLNIT